MNSRLNVLFDFDFPTYLFYKIDMQYKIKYEI